jgi:oligogalacturonide lyase
MIRNYQISVAVLTALGCHALAAAELPTEWIDKDTGHRVLRLSREDGTQSLYFNQNVTTAGGGIATIILATQEVKPLVAGRVSVLVAGHKSGDIYYTKRAQGGPGPATVYAMNVDTGATREVVKLPAGRGVSSLNADETLLLGTYVEGATPQPPPRSRCASRTGFTGRTGTYAGGPSDADGSRLRTAMKPGNWYSIRA